MESILKGERGYHECDIQEGTWKNQDLGKAVMDR